MEPISAILHALPWDQILIQTLNGIVTGMILAPQAGGVPPVPEPTSFALLGLGAAAMLIFRRRK